MTFILTTAIVLLEIKMLYGYFTKITNCNKRI